MDSNVCIRTNLWYFTEGQPPHTGGIVGIVIGTLCIVATAILCVYMFIQYKTPARDVTRTGFGNPSFQS